MSKKIYLSPSSQEENLYAYGNTNEEVQCRRISAACAVALKRCGFDVKDGNYGNMYDRVDESNAWGANLHVAIHTNAFNGETTGTRIFCYNNKGEGYNASQAVFNVLAPVTPGVSENVSVNDFYEIIYTGAPCVYIEVDFHDVPNIAKWIIENVELIGESIAKGICDHFGVKFVEKSKPIEPEESDVLYRVQIGAYKERENAEARLAEAKAAGFTDAFIVESKTSTNVPVVKKEEVIFKKGDKVKMQKNAFVYGTNIKYDTWVSNNVLYVRDVSGDRIVVSVYEEGAITGAVNKKFLTKI